MRSNAIKERTSDMLYLSVAKVGPAARAFRISRLLQRRTMNKTRDGLVVVVIRKMYRSSEVFLFGGVAERLKAPVLKSAGGTPAKLLQMRAKPCRTRLSVSESIGNTPRRSPEFSALRRLFPSASPTGNPPPPRLVVSRSICQESTANRDLVNPHRLPHLAPAAARSIL